MFTFNYGKKLALAPKKVLYPENALVNPKGENVYFVITGKAMLARKTADSYFRMGMAENTLFGLQDSVATENRITSAFTLEPAEIYRWEIDAFFRNISVDIVLAKAATFSLCRELRFLNEKKERSFLVEEEGVDGKIETTEDMEAAGALYGLAFQKESEQIPEAIITMFGKTCEAGETIIAENDLSDEIYLLFEGQVEVSRGGKSICTMDSGEIFGEMSHFERKPRAATIKAHTQARLLKLEPKNFNVLYQLHPIWSINLLKSLCRRIKAAYLRM